MDNIFKFAGMDVEMQPAITKWSFEDLGDEPKKHRWRAHWATDSNGNVHGIRLCAYPVLKTNYSSVWVSESCYRQATKQPWEEGAPGMEWVPFDPAWMKKRLCYNSSGSAWAKPTQEEAIRSLAVRLVRWSGHIAHDVEKARSAAEALEKLRPDMKVFADTARMRLNGKEWTL